ncbi:MAG: HAD family hydrolase [Candidatus Moraniibacteriota bacterium]
MHKIDFGKIEWIFFDLGGVLIDESLAMKIRKEADLKIIKSFGVSIAAIDLEEKWRGEASRMKGDLDKNIFSIFLKNESFVEEALEKLKEERKKWPPHEQRNVVKKEAKEVLQKLSQSFKLGIIANQPVFIRQMLEDAKIIEYFSSLGISNEYNLHKPDPEFFKKVLVDCGAVAEKSMFIDDNIQRGILPAKKLGFKTVWLNNEGGKSSSENYDFQIKSLWELLN